MKWAIPILIGCCVVYLNIGEIWAPIWSVFSFDSTQWTAFFLLRLPRLITALLVGMALALSGVGLQGVLKNPLVEPYILGISSGAALGAALAMVMGVTLFNGGWGVAIGSFLGAILALMGVQWIVRVSRQGSVVLYVLAGIIVNAVLSACLMMVLFSNQEQGWGIMSWIMGDLSRSNWGLLALFFVGNILVYVGLKREAGAINKLALGDDVAASIGVDPERVRRRVFVMVSLLTGMAVMNAGIIGFIGLVSPHIGRLIGGENFKTLIPISVVVSMILMVLSDAVTLSIPFLTHLPVGVVTSLFGGPFFLWVLVRHMRGWAR